MRILVISDSHEILSDVSIESIKKEGQFDMLIHCGDNLVDGEKFSEKLNIMKVLRVPGNCDYKNKDVPPTIIKEIEAKKFIITHGDLYHVKYSLEKLYYFALENNADLVLYGHTHIAQNEIIDNILFFNPGSIMLPKDGKASFGIIEIKEGKIVSKIVRITN